jgi:quercetin dioxygenase-like cupin family protein
MNGKFLPLKDLEIEMAPWGPMAYISRPSTTGAQDIVCIIVDLGPGGFHNFHFHPGQEEVIHLLQGEVEQWVETEKRVMKPGDSVFIGKEAVHATFNIGSGTAKLFVVVSPCIGEAGYGAVDVSSQVPWNELRQ